MKKAVLLFVCVVLASTNVFAFSIPNVTGTSGESITKSVVGDVVKSSVVSDLNKYLAGQNCTCNKNGSVTGCSLSAIGKKVNDNRQGLKIALNRDVNFHSKAMSQACSWTVRDEIKHQYSYWSWYTPYDPSMGKKIKLWVD